MLTNEIITKSKAIACKYTKRLIEIHTLKKYLTYQQIYNINKQYII